MSEEKVIDKLVDLEPIYQELKKLLDITVQKGYKTGWAYHRLIEKYGKEIAEKVWDS